MQTFKKDLTQLFVEGFSEPYICHFPDGYHNGALDIGASYFDMNSFTETPSQPTDDYWIRMLVTEALTFNSSITDGVNKHKRTLVFVDFSVYWPNSKSSKAVETIIEPALDLIYLNKTLRGSDNSEIYSQQDSPKDIVRVMRASGSNKWNEKTIRYPFVVRYI